MHILEQTPQGPARHAAWLLLVGAVVFLVYLPWSFQGMYMRDDGSELTMQLMAWQGRPEAFNLVWLSNLAGGAWLHLTDGLGLWGARLGLVCIKAVSACAVYPLLARLLGRRQALLAVLAAGLATSFQSTQEINYRTLPSLLVVAGGVSLLLADGQGERPRRAWGLALAGGVLLGVGCLSRLTLVAALVLPLVPPLVDLILLPRGQPQRSSWARAGAALAAALLTLALGLAALHLAGHLGDFLHNLRALLSPAQGNWLYNGPTTSQFYLVSLKKTAPATLLVLGMFLSLHLLSGAGRGRLGAALPAVAGLAGLYLLLGLQAAALGLALLVVALGQGGRWLVALGVGLLSLYLWHRCGLWLAGAGAALALLGLRLWPRAAMALQTLLLASAGLYLLRYYSFKMHHVLFGLCLALGMVQLLLLGLDRPQRQAKLDYLKAYLVGLGGALAASLGSTQGLAATGDCLWLLLPVACMALPVSAQGLGDWARRVTLAPEDLRRVGAALLCAVAALGIYYRYLDTGLDLPDRGALTATIHHPRLKLILTSPQRAASLEELFGALDHLTAPGREVLAYNFIPMVHFVTKTWPFLGHPWPDLLGPSEVQRRLAQADAQGRRPQLVVRALVDTRNPQWGPCFSAYAPHDAYAPVKRLLDDWVNAGAYHLVWANRDFQVLSQ